MRCTEPKCGVFRQGILDSLCQLRLQRKTAGLGEYMEVVISPESGKVILMKCAVVIPAYNEEATIGPVIDAVKRSKRVCEAIVVSDGSTDRTVRIARQKGVRVVDLKHNIGKGGAMKKGVCKSRAEIIVFLDADLIGLRPDHVDALVEPVASGRAGMSLGLFDGGRVATDFAQAVTPFLTGQRAVLRQILDEIWDLEALRFGVEVALTKHVKEKGYKVEPVHLAGLTHRTKEEKLGIRKGFLARLKMYWEIVRHVQKS